MDGREIIGAIITVVLGVPILVGFGFLWYETFRNKGGK